MNKCPVENCGRVFQSLFVMEEHIKRRHPKYISELNSSPRQKHQEEPSVTQQISKLPKIKHLRRPSKEEKPVEVYRKSVSKGKPKVVKAMNASNITSVISDSRMELQSSENNSRKNKRPSLNKKNSSSEFGGNKADRLPQLKPVLPKKLQILTGSSRLNKEESFEEKNILYTTAPLFNKKIQNKDNQIRERSRSKGKTSRGQVEGQTIKNQSEQMIMTKTQQGFHEKESKGHISHRPIIKRVVSGGDKTKLLTEETASDKVMQQKAKDEPPKQKRVLEVRKDIKKTIRRDSSLKKGQRPELTEQINFQQRTVVIKQLKGSRLSIPSTAKCQFIFANNLSLASLNLHNLQTLRQISLQHNNLKQLGFLNYPNNYNIEKVFVDHNQLEHLDYLPPALKVLSVTFNQIKDLESNTRQLGVLSSLQEVDFTFCPIRKEPNYRLHVISTCVGLKKIDGIKITKFDLELAGEYARMMDEQMGLIPSSKFQNLVISKYSGSPSTVISMTYEQQQSEMTYEELEKEIAKLNKIMKQTKQNLSIIKTQNEVISSQIQQLKGKQQQTNFDAEALYEKLKTECEALELLNFMQYADEEELVALIAKKEQEVM